MHPKILKAMQEVLDEARARNDYDALQKCQGRLGQFVDSHREDPDRKQLLAHCNMALKEVRKTKKPGFRPPVEDDDGWVTYE
jgi:hypothetical protein